jgi:hypothetical protein
MERFLQLQKRSSISLPVINTFPQKKLVEKISI